MTSMQRSSSRVLIESRSLSSRTGARVVITLLLFALGACSATRTCNDAQQPYRQAQNRAPLRVPEGMAAPDRSAALQIPELKRTPTQPAATRTGCLDEPPSYFGTSGTQARTAEEVVASWAQSWADRNASAVIALYSAQFEAPAEAGRGPWLEQRREQIATGPLPDAKLESLEVEHDGADRRVARFVQRFGSNALRKELVLVREAGSWRIVSERVLDVK